MELKAGTEFRRHVLTLLTAARSSKGKYPLHLGAIAAAGFRRICCTRTILARLVP